MITVILLLGSCVTQQKCDKKFPPSTKDSIVYRDSVVIKEVVKITTKIKDSTIIKEGIAFKDSTPCNENSTTKIVRNGDTFIVKIKNGMVHLDVNLQETISRFQTKEVDKTKEKESTKDSSKIEKKEKIIVRFQQYIPWWVKALAAIGIVALIIWGIKAFIRWKF